MFEISTKKVDFWKENTIIKRNINLDKKLDCFILISSKDSKLWELILNNILDFIIDKISKKNTYNDFSIALESINAFIKSWKKDSDDKLKLDIIIWILNRNEYIFSNIWKASCYLINTKNEVIELTNKEENKKEFNYVSSWTLQNWEIIVSATNRLLNYLSKSDLLDWLILSEDINIFTKNIKNILQSEILNKNIAISSLKYISSEKKVSDYNKLDFLKEGFFKFFDNKLSKNILWYLLVLKDKVNWSSKNIKNWIFLSGILIAIFFLYSILSTVASITTQNEEKELAKENIIKAKTYLRIASENIANPDSFDLNISNAEKLIKEIEKNKVFLNDIQKVNDNINILKKQFDKIEIFEESPENIIYAEHIKNPVKIISNENKASVQYKKPYIITDKWIVWPIIPNKKAKYNIFTSLEENEKFIDATFISDNMYLLTSKSKIVKYTKNGYFSYMDVTWQKTWEKAREIDSYSKNIYLIWEEDHQINKHALIWNKFKAADWYLKKDDLTQIWEILSIAIDWGFYILKKDLSIIKFYRNPYRIEKITLNKLPKNYDLEENNTITDLKARADLNYVYLLMNNKVWVFKPNSKNYKNTTSLTYLWQIEWNKEIIKDFFVNHDWEIVILNNKWLYKINFEISDDRLLIR